MSGLDDAALATAREAIGRSETRRQIVDAEGVRRFAAAIGAEAGRQPVLGHWAWFLPTPPDREIGPDGHPSRGGFLPAIDALPRRMFASTAIRFATPFLLDAPAESTTRVRDVRHKAGRSGDLVFVDVERSFTQDDVICVVETQTVVYRAAGETAPLPLPEPAADAEAMPDEGTVWTPATVNLFRFSAATFNGHRIHYDRPYATQVEGYPGLIVHGPFIAARLAELAAAAGPLATFEFRAQAPCFVDQPIRLARISADEVHAIRCDGAIATVAKVTYR